ncbi:hypothetical protein CDN99_25470 [Roseateles aquatilis]|uniref:ABC transmembrane type-1 domain-containing protein n=1 Tax=Roseateles aquatilis TaxID=431061 RepID=A0A246IUB2_9BURK|nr:hypothetical protein [Roseateles aquatilis]OWQ83818.1 hypothetical protein CDN99_25470 [Roseateles aquatilis]
MTTELLQTLPVFAPLFLRGLLVNLTLAAQALMLGLPVGWMLGGLCRLRQPALRRSAGSIARLLVALMRAAPAFVVMHVLLHARPARWAISAEQAVVLSLAAFAAAYVADQLRTRPSRSSARRRGNARLFLTGLVRVYVVMVLSSGFGAAIGVTDATAVTLRALAQLSTTSDRLWLIGGVVLVFFLLRQGIHGLIGLIARLPARPARDALPE